MSFLASVELSIRKIQTQQALDHALWTCATIVGMGKMQDPKARSYPLWAEYFLGGVMRFATIKGDALPQETVTEALLATAAEGHRVMIEFCPKGHITVYIFRHWYWEACFGTFFHLHTEDWGHISKLIH